MNSKLAILGLGSKSTTYYIGELNRLYNERMGGFSTCPFLMLNTDFDSINSLLPHTSKALNTIIDGYIHKLESYGADYILIPNITLHQTIALLPPSTLKIIHPIELCIEQLKRDNIDQIILFGTKYTMESSFLLNYFNKYGIRVSIPDKKDFDFIEGFRKVVYNDEVSTKLMNEYYLILRKYAKQHPVVLACTELSLYSIKNIELYDMVRIQIEAAVELVVNS